MSKEKTKLIFICGARPNFMKTAPLLRAVDKFNKSSKNKIESILVHTGQHYDKNMSGIFFRDLGMRSPDIYMGVGSGTQGEQAGRIIIKAEKIFIKEKPDIVVVVGDVNSTMACAVAASKLGIRIAHVEAGLRSYDASMPEEINRLITDRLSDYLFTPSRDANTNLIKEGISKRKIFMVGNIMADSLINSMPLVKRSKIHDSLSLKKGGYALLTLHRPSNVDQLPALKGIFGAIKAISASIPVIFPVHPRTKKMMGRYGLLKEKSEGVKIVSPMGYIDFLALEKNASLILTDSGGIQEESTIFNVPCLTLRENTERPITIEQGTNDLVGLDKNKIIKKALKIIAGDKKKSSIPKYWDGKTADRVIKVLAQT